MPAVIPGQSEARESQVLPTRRNLGCREASMWAGWRVEVQESSNRWVVNKNEVAELCPWVAKSKPGLVFFSLSAVVMLQGCLQERRGG